MNQRIDLDQALKQFLTEDGDKVAVLYKHLPHAEPPARLDRAILSEAARAVHRQSRPGRSRWLIVSGYAAGMVLAAGIAWRVNLEQKARDQAISTHKEVISVTPINPTVLNRQKEALEPKGTANTIANPPSQSEVVPVTPIDLSTRQKTNSEPSSSVASPQERAMPPLSPPAKASPKLMFRDESKNSSEQNGIAGESALPRGAVGNRPVPPPVSTISPMSAPPASPSAAVPQAFLEAEERKQDVTSDAAPQPLKKRANKQENEGSTSTYGRPDAVLDKSRSTASHSVELQQNAPLYPEAWLQRIRELAQQGSRQEAIENLRLFRNKYPQHSVPDDLRNLVE